jgi:3-(3-hydroxy-phenyl)propionate hydroxylase
VGLKICGFYFLRQALNEKAMADLAMFKTFTDLEVILISKVQVANQTVVQVTQPDLHKIFDAEEGGFYLIRPDHHIAGRWKEIDAKKVELALHRLKGDHLQGKTLVQFESIDVPYTVPEQIYRLLGNALDSMGEEKKMLMLMKLCLIQALDQANVEQFESNLQAALKNMV